MIKLRKNKKNFPNPTAIPRRFVNSLPQRWLGRIQSKASPTPPEEGLSVIVESPPVTEYHLRLHPRPRFNKN